MTKAQPTGETKEVQEQCKGEKRKEKTRKEKQQKGERKTLKSNATEKVPEGNGRAEALTENQHPKKRGPKGQIHEAGLHSRDRGEHRRIIGRDNTMQ